MKKTWQGWISIFVSMLLSVAVLIASVAAVKETVEAVEEPVVEEVVVEEEPELPKQPDTGEEPTVQCHFYNSDIQNNGDAKDDYNFGPKVEEMDIDPAMAADAEFRMRISIDPALGAADMAWFDSIMGTRYLGLFYDECDKEWDKAMNQAKQVWMAKPDKYLETKEAFFKFLDSATSVEIRERKGLEDQMYMNPYTVDGVPDIIVMKTSEHTGKFLVYTFTIKETTKKEVAYRLDCGFQPTNVEKVMNIKPKSKAKKQQAQPVQQQYNAEAWAVYNYLFNSTTITPTPTPTPTPGPGPGPGPTPPTPTPTPTPPDPNPKDPTKGTPVLPNDDPGPGPNTNNPDNPNTSTKENPNNSNNMTPEQYDKTINEMKEANEGPTSKPGGTPNTPTYTPPSSGDNKPKQDNNGDAGTGYGGIDKPTEEKPSSVSNEPAGDAWDGPPD